MVTRRLVLEGMGPVRRETVEAADGDDPFKFTSDALHWIWSWRLQFQRLLDSTKGQGGGDSSVQERQSYSHASYDEHILAVVGGNLVRSLKATEGLIPGLALDSEKFDALRLLRNLYEHRDEQVGSFSSPGIPKERSGKEFANRFPAGRPWSITYGKDEWFLGGVVGIQSLTDSLVEMETILLAYEDELRSKDEGNQSL